MVEVPFYADIIGSINFSILLDLIPGEQQQSTFHHDVVVLLIFIGIVMFGFEIMSYLALHTGEWLSVKRVPVRGKHLDNLEIVSTSICHATFRERASERAII
jgi:NO-binding membrane sensor protein with MHYT domain